MNITLHKKALFLFIIIFILVSGTSFLIYSTNKKDVQQTIYLAVAGPFVSGPTGGASSTRKKSPLSGTGSANGRDMLQGVELGIQAVQEQRKLENIKIKLIRWSMKNYLVLILELLILMCR